MVVNVVYCLFMFFSNVICRLHLIHILILNIEHHIYWHIVPTKPTSTIISVGFFTFISFCLFLYSIFSWLLYLLFLYCVLGWCVHRLRNQNVIKWIRNNKKDGGNNMTSIRWSIWMEKWMFVWMLSCRQFYFRKTTRIVQQQVSM